MRALRSFAIASEWVDFTRGWGEPEMAQVLAAVAHSDDALIWVGGTIRRTRRADWNWTIVCTCAAGAARVVAELAAEGVIKVPVVPFAGR